MKRLDPVFDESADDIRIIKGLSRADSIASLRSMASTTIDDSDFDISNLIGSSTAEYNGILYRGAGAGAGAGAALGMDTDSATGSQSLLRGVALTKGLKDLIEKINKLSMGLEFLRLSGREENPWSPNYDTNEDIKNAMISINDILQSANRLNESISNDDITAPIYHLAQSSHRFDENKSLDNLKQVKNRLTLLKTVLQDHVGSH